MLSREAEERLKAAGVFTYPIDVPRSDGLMSAIDRAMVSLNDIASNDCYGNREEGCTCEVCRARDAMKALEAATTPIHRTIHPDRLGSAAEAVFVRRWVKLQERQYGVNNGFGLLECLLSPTRVPKPNFPFDSHRPYYVPPMTQRDAEVAATVIQWLGTNCGLCFLQECEREIKVDKAERCEWEMASHNEIRERMAGRVIPQVENLARAAVNHFMRADDKKFEEAVRAVTAAIKSAMGQDDTTYP